MFSSFLCSDLEHPFSNYISVGFKQAVPLIADGNPQRSGSQASTIQGHGIAVSAILATPARSRQQKRSPLQLAAGVSTTSGGEADQRKCAPVACESQLTLHMV